MVFAPAVDCKGEVTGLALLAFDGDKHLVIACARFTLITQILAMIGTSTSVRTSWSALHFGLKLTVGGARDLG